ncbi:MAG: HK97 family phage prohead protease [Pseudoxanthomonas sp.]
MTDIQRELAELRHRVSLLEYKTNGVRKMDVRLSVQKYASSGKRILRGVASVKDVDLQGDIVEPRGGQWKLPVPLLWQHKHDEPIGWVRELTATDSGISVVAEVATGIGKADEIWSMVESKLVDSFSIGFIGHEWKAIPTGHRWTKWTLIELSVVVIPAAPNAKITATRSQHDGAVKLITAEREAALANGAVDLRKR